MKKIIAVILSAVMLICVFPLGVFAETGSGVDEAVIDIGKPIMADFDCRLIDYNPQTGENCEPFYYYDIYDFNPEVHMVYYTNGDYYALDCGLDEVFMYTGLTVEVSSDQSPDNQWNAGEHFFNVKIGDYETSATLDISENTIDSIQISGDRQLLITIKYKDGSEILRSPVYFADISGAPGNASGYMYMADGDSVSCTAMYDADVDHDSGSYTYDDTKNLSFAFGKIKTNAIDSKWLRYSSEQQDVISEFTVLGAGEFTAEAFDYSDKSMVQGVILSYAYRARNEKLNGVDLELGTGGAGVNVSAPSEVVKNAFKAVLGLEISDVSAVAGYNKKTDRIELSGVVYDYMCYSDIESVNYTSDNCVVTYTVYRITDSGDVSDVNGETLYALFDKNNALVSVSADYPDIFKHVDIKVLPEFDNITIDNDSRIIFVRPKASAGMQAGELAAAFEPNGNIFCSPEDKAGTGMTFIFGESPYTVIVIGDADSNGKITASDARAALRIAARLDTPTEIQTMALDLDNNGKISPSEARKILRFAARLDNTL